MLHESGVTQRRPPTPGRAFIGVPPLQSLSPADRAYEFADRVATANLAGSPLIAVERQPRANRSPIGQAFQDIDQKRFFFFRWRGPVVKKWAAEVPSASRFRSIISGARIPRPRGTPRGAVHLTIPGGVFTEECAAPSSVPAIRAWLLRPLPIWFALDMLRPRRASGCHRG